MLSLSVRKKNGRANFARINIAPINLAKLETQNYFNAARAQTPGRFSCPVNENEALMRTKAGRPDVLCFGTIRTCIN
jgi:hypothetical protein